MRPFVLFAARAALVLTLPLLLTPDAPAQDDPETPSEAEAALEAFETALDARDALALFRAVEDLDRSYPDATEKEQEAVRDALARALYFLDDQGLVAIRAARALGEMGEDSAKPIVQALRKKELERHEELRPLREALIRALGATKHPRYVSILIDLVMDREPFVVVAAANALESYKDADQKIRKRAVEQMIKSLERATPSARTNRGNAPGGGYDRDGSNAFLLTRGPLAQAISKLTGAAVATPEDWRAWFNENKKRNWDAEKKED